MVHALPDTATLHAILEHAPGFIVFTDREMNILYVNRTDHGYTPEDAVGSNYLDFLTPEQGRKVEAAFRAALQTGETQYVESFFDPQGDVRKWYSILISLLRVDNGSVGGFISITTEITARKAAERDLAETRRGLIEASHRAGMAEVATGVLHNVGNLLNSVNVAATSLRREVSSSRIELLQRAVGMLNDNRDRLPEFLTTDPKGSRLLELLTRVSDELVAERTRQADDLERLSDHIELMRATIESQQSMARFGAVVETVDPCAMIERALALFRSEFDHRTIRLTVEATSDPVVIDKLATTQILANLIRNAIEAIEVHDGERELTVRARKAGDAVCFEVEDTGCGISSEHLSEIFRHGFTTKPTGHGFGLHASALAAQRMRGRLEVASEGPGKGTTFRLSLPVGGPRA